YSSTSQFNFAAQAQRQPGSSFKTYDLTTAIKQGIDPYSTYYDGSSPITLTLPGGAPWTVHNAEPVGGGVMPLSQATWDSVNVIFPDGKADVTSSSDGNRVLTPGQAYDVTKILEGVITHGTGAGYTYMGCSSEAGKTGTSEGESDAWFVGYTPLYSTAVWTGH